MLAFFPCGLQVNSVSEPAQLRDVEQDHLWHTLMLLSWQSVPQLIHHWHWGAGAGSISICSATSHNKLVIAAAGGAIPGAELAAVSGCEWLGGCSSSPLHPAAAAAAPWLCSKPIPAAAPAAGCPDSFAPADEWQRLCCSQQCSCSFRCSCCCTATGEAPEHLWDINLAWNQGPPRPGQVAEFGHAPHPLPG